MFSPFPTDFLSVNNVSMYPWNKLVMTERNSHFELWVETSEPVRLTCLEDLLSAANKLGLADAV